MVPNHKYEPVARCIYCLGDRYADDEPAHKLGNEHIIPLSIGGGLILPEASCKKCERITSRIEDHCVKKLFDQARPHLRIRARKQGKPRTHAGIESPEGTRVKQVPLQDHPGTIRMFKLMMPPEILLGVSPTTDFSANFILRPVVNDFRERVIKSGNQFRFQIGTNISAEFFGRMLAKIAHAHTVAELGIHGFSPLLPPVIIKDSPYTLSYLIGGNIMSNLVDEQRARDRHEIELTRQRRVDGVEFIVIRIRLFGDLDMPSHYVVAGTSL